MITYQCDRCGKHYGSIYVDPETDDWVCVQCGADQWTWAKAGYDPDQD